MEILCNFQGDFWKNLQRITQTSNNFIEKLQRNLKEILEIFGVLSKICPGGFKALSGTENSANIFQNNILLVSPLTTYSMKAMFASLLAFLQRVNIKNNIDKYQYYRYFQKNVNKYRYEKIFDISITRNELLEQIIAVDECWIQFYKLERK